MPMLCEHALTENGPFDKCLSCQYLGNGCSGPRTTAMTSDRYLMWMKELRKLRGVNNQTIADKTGLSKTTVDDFFAGRRKDIGRITAGMMEDFLIGNAAKWPCAMELAELLGDINCYVNLIPYNKTRSTSYEPSSKERIARFFDILKKNNINVTVRREFGNDVSAACGQLSADYRNV